MTFCSTEFEKLTWSQYFFKFLKIHHLYLSLFAFLLKKVLAAEEYSTSDVRSEAAILLSSSRVCIVSEFTSSSIASYRGKIHFVAPASNQVPLSGNHACIGASSESNADGLPPTTAFAPLRSTIAGPSPG